MDDSTPPPSEYLPLLRVFRFATRGCGTNQETTRQCDSGQCDSHMGHDASSSKVSNCSTIRLSPYIQAVLPESIGYWGGHSPRNRQWMREFTQAACYNWNNFLS